MNKHMKNNKNNYKVLEQKICNYLNILINNLTENKHI